MAVDDFNRADGGLGANWTAITGGGWFPFTITGNEACCANIEASAARYNADTPANDQEASVTLGTMPESQVGKGAGALCRGSSSANTFYFAIMNTAGAGEREYGKMVADTLTLLGAYTAGGTPVTGDRLAVRAVGTRISMRAADVEVAFTTDAAIASGYCGIVAWGWNAATPSIDNWIGGGLVPAGPDITHMWIPPINHRMAA